MGERQQMVAGWTPEAWTVWEEDDGDLIERGRRETPRPAHAVLAVIDEDSGEFILADRTLCGRLATSELEGYLPLIPYENTATSDRCAPCEHANLTGQAGLETSIPRFLVR